jgi:hypothetical protein
MPTREEDVIQQHENYRQATSAALDAAEADLMFTFLESVKRLESDHGILARRVVVSVDFGFRPANDEGKRAMVRGSSVEITPLPIPPPKGR